MIFDFDSRGGGVVEMELWRWSGRGEIANAEWYSMPWPSLRKEHHVLMTGYYARLLFPTEPINAAPSSFPRQQKQPQIQPANDPFKPIHMLS